jgi:hypothetical protein
MSLALDVQRHRAGGLVEMDDLKVHEVRSTVEVVPDFELLAD